MVATSLLAAGVAAVGSFAVYGPGVVAKNVLGALVGALKMPIVYVRAPARALLAQTPSATLRP